MRERFQYRFAATGRLLDDAETMLTHRPSNLTSNDIALTSTTNVAHVSHKNEPSIPGGWMERGASGENLNTN